MNIVPSNIRVLLHGLHQSLDVHMRSYIKRIQRRTVLVIWLLYKTPITIRRNGVFVFLNYSELSKNGCKYEEYHDIEGDAQ